MADFYERMKQWPRTSQNCEWPAELFEKVSNLDEGFEKDEQLKLFIALLPNFYEPREPIEAIDLIPLEQGIKFIENFLKFLKRQAGAMSYYNTGKIICSVFLVLVFSKASLEKSQKLIQSLPPYLLTEVDFDDDLIFWGNIFHKQIKPIIILKN